jgi:hypothetical protein
MTTRTIIGNLAIEPTIVQAGATSCSSRLWFAACATTLCSTGGDASATGRTAERLVDRLDARARESDQRSRLEDSARSRWLAATVSAAIDVYRSVRNG